MRQDPEERAQEKGDRVTPAAERGATAKGKQRMFLYQTVVGVVDDPADLEAAVQELVSSGFVESEVHVLCGTRGIQQIDAKGKRKGLLATKARARRPGRTPRAFHQLLLSLVDGRSRPLAWNLVSRT